MSILSAAQKFSFAKIYDGQSEVLLQKLIDDVEISQTFFHSFHF